jgi:thiamine biosynthesis lipoprotein
MPPTDAAKKSPAWDKMPRIKRLRPTLNNLRPMKTNLRLNAALAAALVLASCQPTGVETELSGPAQGTTYHIKMVLTGQNVNPEELRKRVEETFADIDVKLSNYRQDSEISKLNQAKTTDWLPVSKEIAEIVAISKTVHGLSAGCLDLTIKPLFDLWGFSKHETKVPAQADIDRVLTHVGMDKVLLDEAGLRLRKTDPEIGIDLSAVAQGYSVGAIARLLEANGIQNYMAEIGGEMKVKGRKATGEEWRIAIEKPTPFSREVQKIIAIHQVNGEAVMTSGTYRNFFEEGGKTYSHILNPKTGWPVEHNLLSVTVLHDDPTWADAWDTALLCQGEDEGMKTADANQLRALFIYHEGKELKERLSSELVRVP